MSHERNLSTFIKKVSDHRNRPRHTAARVAERDRLSVLTYYLWDENKQKQNNDVPTTALEIRWIYKRRVFYKSDKRVWKHTATCLWNTLAQGGRRHPLKECTCVFVCNWVWGRLQLRGEAIAIPTDLKTTLPTTSKCRGMEKTERENVSEHQGNENTESEI